MSDAIVVLQLTKAEAALLDIRKLFESSKETGKQVDYSELNKLSDDFYSALPHNNQHRDLLTSKKLVAQKYDLCQVST